MYVVCFICFLGMDLITQCLILFIGVVSFQISAYWIILAEERWCIKEFGATYKQYMRSVRRYGCDNRADICVIRVRGIMQDSLCYDIILIVCESFGVIFQGVTNDYL